MSGKIVAGVLAPHPPHLVYAENPPQNEPKSECGWEELRWGYERCRKTINASDYDVIIVHTPHWFTHTGHHVLCVPEMSSLSVDPVFPNLFRYHYKMKVDTDLAKLLHKEIVGVGLQSELMTNPSFRVDYGTIISGHMINPTFDKPIVSISANAAYFDYSNDVGQQEMLKLGEATRKAVEKSGKRALLLASTSLSHRHFTEEPALPEDMTHEHIYNHNQYLWDMMVLKLMKKGKSKQLFDVMTDFIDQSVSECKTGGLSWLLSSMDFPESPAEVHAYGSVIGTGNAVVSWSMS
ncbi:MAG: tRNA U-34 5-methylaminomethyl-2-thiouridine biosynthesis protein [Bdellovibrionales bacterium]